MIFHPGILALVSGSIFVTFMMLYAAAVGTLIVLRWDFQSSSAYQLSLERKTYLISTIINYVLGFQIISSLLFVYTVDDIHKLFVASILCLSSQKVIVRYIHSLAAAVFLFVALSGIVSFVSIYIYELPTHNCPFDILQSGYWFIGYPLYLTLFCLPARNHQPD